MRHRSVQRRLSLYIDGDLRARQRRRVESHLADCPDCGRVLRTLTAVVARLRLLRDGPDDDVVEGVVARLRREAD